MTDQTPDLDAIEVRARAARELHWIVDEVEHHNVIAVDQEPVADGFGYPNVAISTHRYAAHIAGMDPTTTLALTAEVRKLREALGPFADAWARRDEPHAEATHPARTTVFLDDCRRAHDALLKPKEPSA